ncbi:hypothetical protein O4J56_15670 [Nocardiopsis sp. RSe5-2]|uniref:Guanylate cyclase domain-containing protein n=1 Tax=Nocardiopsis endophytica TaxID=3018445 RepID=A0ABT4U6V5_9ACTN|nr:hypothetical protein [Nocardiopsis endophytica]MDA2812082.1 hypothetical protein [Nocardiopsis endophytica]
MGGRIPERTRRLIIATDAEAYSARDYTGQVRLQEDLHEVLEAACTEGGLDRASWELQVQGDGEIAVLPVGTPEDTALSAFLDGLAQALHHHNRPLNDAYRVRLRVAVHQGNVAYGRNGFVGTPINEACRLRDCDLVRNALADAPGADFVTVLSHDLYKDAVADGTAGLYRWPFERVAIEIPSKAFRAEAWLCVSSASGQGTGAGQQGGREGSGGRSAPEGPAPAAAPSGKAPDDGAGPGRAEPPTPSQTFKVKKGDMTFGDHYGPNIRNYR